MAVHFMVHTISTAELPYPDGWFAVAYENQVPPGTVLRRRLMDDEIVIYRTADGKLRVIDPYCPHLGAHFGYGGRVDAEDLVCPFHHFAFGPDGLCVRTGYGRKVPQVALRHYAWREVNGVVMVWWHARGLPPQWEVPEVRDRTFPDPIRRTTVLTAYPQDINENAFDVGHFPTLHGYRSARSVSYAFEGVRSQSRVDAERYFPLVGALTFPLEAEGYGVGMTHIRARMPQINAEADTYFFSTPIGPRLLELRVSASLKFPVGIPVSRAAQRAAAAVSWALTRTLGPSLRKDLKADHPVWSHKAYVDRPRLADGDGPIGLYRRWAAQFYTTLEDVRDASQQYDGTLREPPSSPSRREPRTRQPRTFDDAR
ncbi:Rieske 2Fe-2S domain-containing protein [Streptomyces sp. NPDC005122]